MMHWVDLNQNLKINPDFMLKTLTLFSIKWSHEDPLRYIDSVLLDNLEFYSKAMAIVDKPHKYNCYSHIEGIFTIVSSPSSIPFWYLDDH